ncbi:MAG: SpoIIE family protein phosphatase, partial [Proteobacteria bacterium]|nr:SpoIIE family protein phosphatase [Pseudomonadota bacterium]
TDGIPEARDSSGNMFSEEKLADLFQKLGNQPANDIRKGILAGLTGYEKKDDFTFVVIKKY